MISSVVKKKKSPEIVIFLVYMILLAVIMYFHEPWFDEAQAWLIARDADLKELFTSILHYEGHTPLWFLILMPFAKNGIPFELGLKLVSFVFSSAAMGFVIFKAPFKRKIRFIIPFTYFFFYQFGVISRPYCAMMLGFVLCAMFYKTRNEKPWRFVLSMAFLCMLSPYGILLCGGITIVWIGQLYKGEKIKEFVKEFVHKKSFIPMIFLLIVALFCIFCIIPFPDTSAVQGGIGRTESLIPRFFYNFLVAPADATIYNSQSYYFISYDFTDISLIVGAFVGLVINTYFIVFGYRNKKLSLLIIPYVFLGIFNTLVYFSIHHIGIIAVFLLFYMWCCYDDRPDELREIKWYTNIVKNEKDRNALKKLANIITILMIVIPVYWSIAASINEINLMYGRGRGISEFINENNMDKFDIMSQWNTFDGPDGEKVAHTNILTALPVQPYYDRNIIFNCNLGNDDVCYVIHRVDDNTENLEAWRKIVPDLLIGDPDLKYVYGEEVVKYDYALVKESGCNRIWKGSVFEQNANIYLRRDHLKDYPHLKDLKNIPDKLIRDKYKN